MAAEEALVTTFTRIRVVGFENAMPTPTRLAR
jgi:hypothetical protein